MAETESNVCSICLESIDENADRGMARLGCKHFFHLDCIGSQFNYRGGEMSCPNCRVVEHGQWLYSGAESLQQQEEQQEEGQEEEEQTNDIYSDIEDPQGHFHPVMPTGHYWWPNGGFQLHPPFPPPQPPPPPDLPVRRMHHFGHALDYHNQLRAGIDIGTTDREVTWLNYEPVILSHRNSGAARFAPYPVRQQRQSNNFPLPAPDMLNRPTWRPSSESISPPLTRSHQQWFLGSDFQSQPTDSGPFPPIGRWILQGNSFVLQFND